MFKNLIFATVFALMISTVCSAQNWPRFRGENGNGVVAAKLPSNWTEKDYLWQKTLPGVGSSSPVIWGDNLIITSSDAKTAKLTIQCLNSKSGKEQWAKSFGSKSYRMHSRNSFASSTPALDKDRIYFAMAEPEHVYLIALDYSGEEIWKRDFGTWTSQHGFSMSPMVYKDKVIFVNSQLGQRGRQGQPAGKSTVIAVNSKTGKDVWQTPLKATRACYALPCLVETKSGPQLIGTNTGNGFYSINPDDGKMNWDSLPFQMRTVASTISAGGLLFGSNGSGGGGNYLVAAKPTSDGAKKAYSINQSANYVPTPIAVNELLFLFGDKGIVTCADLKTGTEHWKKRLSRGFSGSPVSDGENVYAMDEAGTAIVIRASKKHEVVSKIDLGQASRSTPAISDNKIYFRTKSKLFCLGAKE